MIMIKKCIRLSGYISGSDDARIIHYKNKQAINWHLGK